MRKILLVIFIFPFLTFCQLQKKQIDSKNATELNKKSIVGIWEFQKLIDRTGVQINEVVFELNDTIKGIEKVDRPSIRINKDGTYELFDCPNPNSCDKGTWEYRKNNQILILTFDEPKYNVPIDKIAPKLIEELKKNGTIIEFTADVWELEKSSNDKMQVREYLFEMNYNLRILRKK